VISQRQKQIARISILAISISPFALAQDFSAASEAQKAHPGWVQIPGELIRPDCVHEIPNGAKVETSGGQITGDITVEGTLVAHYDACPEAPVLTRPVHGATPTSAKTPGTGNGWVEAAQTDLPLSGSDNIDFMAGTWTVPSNPSANGGLIYLFNGLEPATENWILQPVLQWGNNGLFGGNNWVIASWMVGPNNYAFHSPAETVYAGHSIFGYTEITGTSGSTLDWRVQAQDTTSGAYSWITATTSGLHWTWGFAGVLEAYYITSCSEFPSSGHTTFSNSAIDHEFPYYNPENPAGWYGAIYGYGGPSCGFGVYASTTSTLYF
jgi:hypothetical protein